MDASDVDLILAEMDTQEMREVLERRMAVVRPRKKSGRRDSLRREQSRR